VADLASLLALRDQDFLCAGRMPVLAEDGGRLLVWASVKSLLLSEPGDPLLSP